MPIFTDENIMKLFGEEAAESEDPERLDQYFVSIEKFQSFYADLPLRILIGHKGSGKSAFVNHAMRLDDRDGFLCVKVNPSDIEHLLQNNEENFLSQIALWKNNLQDVIFEKVAEKFSPEVIEKNGLGFIRNQIISSVTRMLEKVDGSRLSPSKRGVIQNYTTKSKIRVYIDDLDRGWKGSEQNIASLSAMINAIRDLVSENRGLQVKLSIRPSVFHLLRTSDESTDKFETSIVWLSWTNHDIILLLAKRVQTFLGNDWEEGKYLNWYQKDLCKLLEPAMVDTFQGMGKWSNVSINQVLTSMIRKRPRDLVKLCSLAAKVAKTQGHQQIQTGDFTSVFENYSLGRLQDTFIEYQIELPEIQTLIEKMRPNRGQRKKGTQFVFNRQELIEKIKNSTSGLKFYLSGSKSPATPEEIAWFLYKINFLQARKTLEDGYVQRFYFEENQYLFSKNIDHGYEWEIHPAYRWALQPDVSAGSFYDVAVPDAEA